MTDDTAAPQPTPSPGGGSWRIPLAVGALVVVIVVVVALATRGGDDDDTQPAADATTSTASGSSSPSPSASQSPTTSGSPSASASPSDNGDPVASPIIDKAVRAALRNDFPALVPSGVPAGWTVVSAAYAGAGGGRWTIELTDPDGAPVRLVQTTQEIDDLVAEGLGMAMTPSGTVDLGEYGTGKWTVYTGGDETAIVTKKKIAGTSALVVGPDQDTVVALGEQLLTAEDGEMPEAG